MIVLKIPLQTKKTMMSERNSTTKLEKIMILSSTLETLKINWQQSELLRLKVRQMQPWMRWLRKTGIWRVKLLHHRQMLPSTYLKNWKDWKPKMDSSEEIRSPFWRWNNPDLVVSFINCFLTTNQCIFFDHFNSSFIFPRIINTSFLFLSTKSNSFVSCDCLTFRLTSKSWFWK